MSNAIVTYRPSLLGRGVMNDVFDTFFSDFPKALRQSTQGYPVADIFKDDDGNTVLEFALAGFAKEHLTVNVQPDKRSITVSAKTDFDQAEEHSRRIARRNFQKTFVNYDDNLDLTKTSANFENGLLTVVVPQRPEIQPLTIDIQ
jgi:HSP20 family protein